MPGPRTLVIMRHAKAEQFGDSDPERPLTEGGRRGASAAASWLAQAEIVPDHVLVSSAVRALQTWQEAADAAGWQVDPDVEPGLYDASPESALDVVRAVPQEARTVMLVGHNPTVASLAQLLDDGLCESEASDEMARGFPAASLAVFQVEAAWQDLEYGAARLVAFRAG